MKINTFKKTCVFVMFIVSFLLIGTFLVSGLTNGFVLAVGGNGGGVFVGSSANVTLSGTTISGNTATNGGGVYVSSGGTFTMSSGTVSGNISTSENGHNVYNAGIFTMNGGTVGTSGSGKTYGIYNSGTMNLYGGTIYDNIYSSTSFTIKPSVTVNGIITLSNSAKITVQNYAGTTPSLNINVANTRTEGTILTLQGSSTIPNLSKLNITGHDTSSYEVEAVQGSTSTEWNVVLEEVVVERNFPSTWKTEVQSTDYMTTTVSYENLTSIKFETSIPSGYNLIGKLSTELEVYQDSTNSNAIAFVNGKTIFAPKSCSNLFSNLSSLTTLTFNNFNTSNVTYMAEMFYKCSKLISLDLSGFDTSKVFSMHEMFYDCSKLTSLDVSGFNTWNVSDICGMFCGCSDLTSLDVSGFRTSIVIDMYEMFKNCSNLTSLDVSRFDTSNVTDMEYMFSGCSGLKSLDVSGFDTSKVTNMGEMFRNCSNITSLDVSGFNTSNVTNMYNMFYGCSKLASLDVSGFDTSKVTEMWGMFDDCSNITSLDVSGFNTSNVTNMNNMFSDCSNITSLDVSGFDTSNVTNMYNMFYGCSKLTSLDISGFNTSSVMDMKYMFIRCSKLTSLDLSGFDTSNVTDMECMFKNCSGLTSLDVSGFDTSNVNNMWSMFSGCSGLMSLDLSSFNMSKVTSSGSMLEFGSKGSLKHLKTPYNNLSSIAITNGSTLYNVATGSSVSSVPSNTSSSLTLATKLTVTLDSNEGTCSTSSLSVYYGESLSNQGVSLPTATKSGYSFWGWYSSVSGGTKYTESSVFTENKTIYARYKQEATNALVDFGIEEQNYFNGLVAEGTSSMFFCGSYMGDINAIAFLSAYKNSNTRYTFENMTQEVGEFYACIGTPKSPTKVKNILSGYKVLCFMPLNSEAYIMLNENIFNILNSFTNVAAIDLRGCDPSTWSGTFAVPENVSIVVLPQSFSGSVRASSDTEVYTYTGSTYSNIELFASPLNLSNIDFEKIEPFVLENDQMAVEINTGDEKILDTKRKIKIISKIKKQT